MLAKTCYFWWTSLLLELLQVLPRVRISLCLGCDVFLELLLMGVDRGTQQKLRYGEAHSEGTGSFPRA